MRFPFRGEELPPTEGEMIACDPPRVLEFTWGFAQDDTEVPPEYREEQPERSRFELTPEGEVCRLTFTTTYDRVGKSARDAAGWHVWIPPSEGRRQLIVYHFMWLWDEGRPRDEGCPSCSAGADEVSDGLLRHLHARDTTLAYVSRAPFGKIDAYRKKKGWTFPFYSSHLTALGRQEEWEEPKGRAGAARGADPSFSG